jgi:hypothetical protein
MKKYNYLMVAMLSILLSACGGSETYRGKWKATDANGAQLEITFQENSFSIKSDGDSSSFSYSQNSVKIENSVETYGIKLDDGRGYQIHFPIANDESRGVMNDANGDLLYTISREDYINSEEIYKLK